MGLWEVVLLDVCECLNKSFYTTVSQYIWHGEKYGAWIAIFIKGLQIDEIAKGKLGSKAIVIPLDTKQSTKPDLNSLRSSK